MRSISMLSMLSVAACLVVAGCQEPDASPTTAGTPTRDNGKGQQVLTDGCINAFAGITSCPIGNGTLVYSEPDHTLTVTGFGGAGNDGVSSAFTSGTHWRQDGEPSLAENQYILYNAISEGNAVSTMQLTRDNSTTITAAPTFTGSPVGFHYKAEIYDGAHLVRTLTNLTGTFKQINPPPVGGGDGCWAYRMEFGSVNGHCQWVWTPFWQSPCRIPQFDFGVRGTFNADKVVITEEITSGQYPYHSFERIDVKGTLSSYAITGESAP